MLSADVLTDKKISGKRIIIVFHFLSLSLLSFCLFVNIFTDQRLMDLKSDQTVLEN